MRPAEGDERPLACLLRHHHHGSTRCQAGSARRLIQALKPPTTIQSLEGHPLPTQVILRNTDPQERKSRQRRPCRRASGSLQGWLHCGREEGMSCRTGKCRSNPAYVLPRCSPCTTSSCSSHSPLNLNVQEVRSGESRWCRNPPPPSRAPRPARVANSSRARLAGPRLLRLLPLPHRFPEWQRRKLRVIHRRGSCRLLPRPLRIAGAHRRLRLTPSVRPALLTCCTKGWLCGWVVVMCCEAESKACSWNSRVWSPRRYIPGSRCPLPKSRPSMSIASSKSSLRQHH